MSRRIEQGLELTDQQLTDLNTALSVAVGHDSFSSGEHRRVLLSKLLQLIGNDPNKENKGVAAALVDQLETALRGSDNTLTLNGINDALVAIVSTLNTNDDNLDTLQEVVDAIKTLQSTVSGNNKEHTANAQTAPTFEAKESPSNANAVAWAPALGAKSGDLVVYTAPSGAPIRFRYYINSSGSLVAVRETLRPEYSVIPDASLFTPGWEFVLITGGKRIYLAINQHNEFIQQSDDPALLVKAPIIIDAMASHPGTNSFEAKFPDPSDIELWIEARIINVGGTLDTAIYYRGIDQGVAAWIAKDAAPT